MKKEILDWFKTVQRGIRAEYEQGVSRRKDTLDYLDLAALLEHYKQEILEYHHHCGL